MSEIAILFCMIDIILSIMASYAGQIDKANRFLLWAIFWLIFKDTKKE